MEQVLSSPQGCSEWEVSGKGEWESDPNPLGFLIMDKDNSTVKDSTDEIFQDNALSIDDLFWASQYSGQSYPWENDLECVCPEWETPTTHPQDLIGEDYLGISDDVVGDLISFNSMSTSPASSDIPVQSQNSFYDFLGEQTPNIMEPTKNAAVNPLDEICIDDTGNDFGFQTEEKLLEETHLTNCDFSHDSLMEMLFVNEESRSSSSHETVTSSGLLSVSLVEVSCTNTHSNPKPSIICQTPPTTCKHDNLSSSDFPHGPITSVTFTESSLLPSYEASAFLPEDKMQILSPELLAGGLYSEQESCKPSASNNEPQSLETTDTNTKTTEEPTLLTFEEKTVCTRPESCISPEPCEEICDTSPGCKEVRANGLSDNPLADLTSINPLNELETEAPVESTSALSISTPEHYALHELPPESDTCHEDHSPPTSSPTDADALFALPNNNDGDFNPDITFDNVITASCEAIQSSDSCKSLTSSEIDDLQTTQDCDATSPDFKSDVRDEFRSNTGNSENVVKAIETPCADIPTTTDNIEDPYAPRVTDTNILSDFHYDQEETTLTGNLNCLKVNDDLSRCIPENHQELNKMGEECQEQITIHRNTDNTLVESLKTVDQLNNCLSAKAGTIVKDTIPLRDNHNTPSKVEEKLHRLTSHKEEISDYMTSIQNQVILQRASDPDSPESTPFTFAGDQLTMMGGLVRRDQETTEVPNKLSEATEEKEAELSAQPAHHEDFNQVILSQIDLPQEQQVSSPPSSPPSPKNVFPCGVGLDGEAYLTLMENNPDTPNIPKHAEMTLDLCKASDAQQTKSLHDQRVPADLINVPVVSVTTRGNEEHSALRAVFQALDQDGDGFVHIEEFMEFAKAYGAEQVKDLTRFLDPSGLGVISFEDFHRGISAISGEGSDPDLIKTQLSSVEASGPPEEYDEQAEVSDSAYLGSESAYSECETFTDEDTTALVHPELHEDVETDSGIENTLTDGDERNSMMAVIGGEEEHFEDFGESNNASDLLLADQEEGREALEEEGDAESRPHPDSPLPRPLMLLTPSPRSFPASFQSFLQSEALEFFCTHCHKQISRLEDLSTRLQLLEMNSSSKRLSSKKAARHLQQSTNLDVMGDLNQDILDLADRDITDKVLLLEKRVCELETDSSESEEQIARLRQENLTLVHRANALEEQLKEQELRSEENTLALTRKHRDALTKLQRERDLEIENLQARLHQLDEENSELRSCVPCLRANIERLEEEKRKLQDELDDISERLNEESESRQKMSDKMSHERHTNHKEKECTQGLIEDLRKQLEHLQLFKLETEARRGRSSSNGLQEYNTHMRENELEQEIRRLKQDNRGLKEQNDELNGQIINLSIQGAKSLFTESLSESLAAEINNVSRGELMEAIHKQEEINFRLQDYIDRIIVAIMESNPSILEVKY
ncbi:rab11 family-interacting protein 3 isoform X2 [Paramisgurnus dabryanus]|uniref:rab11 family-interacting protein 3 isoform X2 n=1 Tax=Paramisgurnus dabryanus TaxID=90735 RepID=UPI0031F3C52D